MNVRCFFQTRNRRESCWAWARGCSVSGRSSSAINEHFTIYDLRPPDGIKLFILRSGFTIIICHVLLLYYLNSQTSLQSLVALTPPNNTTPPLAPAQPDGAAHRLAPKRGSTPAVALDGACCQPASEPGLLLETATNWRFSAIPAPVNPPYSTM